MAALDGFDALDPRAATRLLASESESGDETADELADVASLLGGEEPVLRWAAGLARTVGWGPLRPRLAEWTLPDTRLPWRDAVDALLATLPPADTALLATLAACDAPFAWDVLEAVAPAVSIEAICRLEEAKVLTRRTRAGVVTFLVPYAVRAVHRVRDGTGLNGLAAHWLDAWVKRAADLRRTTYGPSSRATLAELAAAVPLAERALFVPDRSARGLALWIAVSDALFFGDAIPFDAPAFMRAVTIADQDAVAPEPRVRARIVASRALLERGDPTGAARLAREAQELAGEALTADALRAVGWAELALTTFDAAQASFARARALTEGAGDARGQADATAGLGVLALLGGDAVAARALLDEAVAIHVVMRDAPREAAVRGMMELLPDQRDPRDEPGQERLAAQVDEFRANGQRWREALALARLALAARARGDAEAERTRLFEARAAATLSSMPASKLVRGLVEATTSARPLVVGSEGRTLALPDGTMHDLARHGPVRRVLWALASARADRPGSAMTTLEMIEAGWPGEKMQHEAATLRVYTTVRRLRGLGLTEALLTRDDGYLLDPEVPVTLER